MTNHYVVFSGGFDSTLMLINLIKKKLNYFRTYTDILNIISFIPSFVPEEKRKLEKQARDKILEKIREEFKIEFRIYTIEVNIDGQASSPLMPSVGKFMRGKTQPIFWICNVFAFVPFENDALLYFGYIKDDNPGPVIDAFNDILTQCQILLHKPMLYYKMPLIYVPKEQVIVSLFEYGIEYLDLCHMCEGFPKNDNKYCGVCDKCTGIKRVFYSILGNPKYKNNRKLRKWINTQLELINKGAEENGE